MKMKFKTPKDKGLLYGLAGLVGLAVLTAPSGSGETPGAINSVYHVGDRWVHMTIVYNNGVLTDYYTDGVVNEIIIVDRTYEPYAYRIRNTQTGIISVIPGPDWEYAVSVRPDGLYEWSKV